MRRLIFLLLIGIVFLSGCTQPQQPSGQRVEFTTSDGVKIVGTYYDGGDKSVILLHRLGKDRNDWNNFVPELQAKGYSVLAIDLRGHGESITKNGERISWIGFSDSDFNSMTLDVMAAKEFLASKGKSKFAIIGESIGANTALNYAAEDSDIKSLVLLSPSLDYRGVKTDQSIKSYRGSLLIVASESDAESIDASQQMFTQSPADKQIKTYPNAGHGTDMFLGTDLDKVIIDFLASKWN